MFARRPHQSSTKRSFREQAATGKRVEKSKTKRSFREQALPNTSPPVGSTLTSPILTLCVGPEQRLFAAHEDVLSNSPFFSAIIRGQFLESTAKRVNLPEDIPEVFSSVLEYLYKGDYYPRLLHNKRRNTWELEDAEANNGGRGAVESTVFHPTTQQVLLKDTLLYCTAERYGLEELKRLALRKQGLQSGIQCSTILASARYAYENTPESDSKLRAHYLALIIRSRNTFKRSGTMQVEMEAGGKMFFDLWVAMFVLLTSPLYCTDHAIAGATTWMILQLPLNHFDETLEVVDTPLT
ncbi:hypothetical protein MMC13_008220 [Lambiella insularis]|nr:hypothetical protein [Lambiella insularis]